MNHTEARCLAAPEPRVHRPRRVSAIYVLSDARDGIAVYVGQSVDVHRRLYIYRAPRGCHNAELQQWLDTPGRQLQSEIYPMPAFALDVAEKLAIRLNANLFNRHEGGPINFASMPSVPWGKRGECPSQFIRRGGRVRMPRDYDRAVARMTMKQRVLFEIDVAQWASMNYPIFDENIDAWVRDCGAEMVAILES